uniref:Helicase C-terminal domain-containing protein n=1 Tax=Haptolina ericina TaxID=156174 RepID=A0A7S3AJF1_9EUKA
MNAIVYHGSNESRELIRTYEFLFADAATNPNTRGMYKFQVLITSYEVVKQDLDKLRKIPWRYLVVDEAHRLKNKDSALAQDLRTLEVEHMHLLSGTPLQNNTTELWALLYFLDPALFPSLELFLRDFGTLTDSSQVDRLNEKIRPYLLRRQKGDVEKSLVPLDETIIWVEMTIFQKKCYRAILEGNREILVDVKATSMPSLVNIQMELRKCCNHPYLIKGVEETNTRELAKDEHLGSLLKASGKFVLLDKLLPKLKSEGHRVLIFSQMVKMLDMLSDYLRERRYSHERLDGTVRGDLRQAAIDRFCKPGSETFIFLLSTRAGGLGINLTAADTCIIMDSDWNPQNDVQAMARSHRIGQSRKVKVFRLVTRNTYESEMVERANKKLGLERAMNADRANDGLKDSKDNGKHGPPQDRGDIDAMLKRGAHDIFMNEDDTAFQKFNEADIDEILQSSSTRVSYDQADSSTGSVFSRAAFVADDSAVDMDDPEFWTKILPELEQKDAALAEYFLKRKSKQVKRFGMAEGEEVEDFLDDFIKGKKGKGGKSRDEDDARRAAKRALAHVWSKTERMNCERALLSVGFGRWGRIKELAQGGTKMRSEQEIAAFGVAFVCLCVGLPIGTVGVVVPSAEEEQKGIQRARELLSQMGCAMPTLSPPEVEELEPLVTAGGVEYAERVHKLGSTFLQRLLFLKRLSDAIEREPSPLETYRAPVVRGGVGRELDVPWTPRDDAMLLLGVYKHGFRAYEEVRDDPELTFSCLVPGPALPAPMPQPAVPNARSTPVFDELDVLPLPPGSRTPKKLPLPPASAATRAPCFMQEREFRERVKALLDSLAEEERQRDERVAWEAEWEEERRRELRGEPPRPSKKARGGSGLDEAASSAAADAEKAFEAQLARVWATTDVEGGYL